VLDVVKCHFIYCNLSLHPFCLKLKFAGRFVKVMNKLLCKVLHVVVVGVRCSQFHPIYC